MLLRCFALNKTALSVQGVSVREALPDDERASVHAYLSLPWPLLHEYAATRRDVNSMAKNILCNTDLMHC